MGRVGSAWHGHGDLSFTGTRASLATWGWAVSRRDLPSQRAGLSTGQSRVHCVCVLRSYVCSIPGPRVCTWYLKEERKEGEGGPWCCR